jgi:tetratricopeptide (TPR) repeat protein
LGITMNVHIIETLSEIERLRENWEQVCAQTPEANFFVSWTWIYGLLKYQQQSGVPWFVVAVNLEAEGEDYVAFFPLSVFTRNDADLGLYSQLGMSGVTDSHYPGFICIPDYEAEAAAALATYLQDQEVWSVVELQHIQPQSLRWQHFLSQFSEERAKVIDARERVYKDALDEIDNSICPYVSLPDDWESYVQGLGASTRKNLRKKLKRFAEQRENPEGCHIVYADAENIDWALDALLGLWQANWESRKGAHQCKSIASSWRNLLKHCFEQGCVYLPVLQWKDHPVGAVAHFVDKSRKALLSFVSARDESFDKFPPGLILHAEAIRYAIDQGFETYDFLMGNEAYKYSFGVQEREVTTLLIHRQNWVYHDILLNPRSIPEAIAVAESYHREGQLEEAKKRYQQILASSPDQPSVLYSLAVLLQRKGDYAAATAQFQQLLHLQPENARVWFSLGALHQQQGQLSAAVETYRQALNRAPVEDTVTLALYLNLGYALQQQEQWDEATECYQRARELDPTSTEAEVMWANARHTQGKLPAEELERYATLNLRLGHRRRQASDLQSAVDYYRQALALQPDWAEAHHHLGLALQSADNFSWDEVITCYEKALALAPGSAEISASLAQARFAQGQLSPEEQARYAVVNYELATQCQQQEDWGTAADYYRNATQLKPGWAEAHCKLGLALQKAGSGHLEEIIACFQTAQALDPNLLNADVSLANVRFSQGTLPPEQQAFYAYQNHELGHHYQQAGELLLAIDHYRQAVAMEPDFPAARHSLRLALQAQSNGAIKVSVARESALSPSA